MAVSKILVVASEPPYPDHNGVRRKLYSLILELSRRVDVELLYPAWPSLSSRSIRGALPSVSAFRSVEVAPDMGLSGVVRRLGAEMCRMKEFGKSQYDLVHLDTFGLGVLAVCSRFLGPRTVWSMNDARSRTLASIRPQPHVKAYGRSAARRAVVRELERSISRCVSAVDVVAEQEAAYLRGIGVRNVRIVPLGRPVVDLRRIALTREQTSCPEGGIVVGLMTSLAGIHGDSAKHFILSAWPVVRSRLPGSTLRLVGRDSGGGLPSWAGGIDGLEWVPVVDRIEGFLGAVDVVVAPLPYAFGVSTKALEALSAGIPVIGMGCLTSIVSAVGPSCGVILCDSVAEMAAAIVEAGNDSEMLVKLKLAASGASERWPSWDEIAGAYLDNLG